MENKLIEVFKLYSFRLYPNYPLSVIQIIESEHGLNFYLDMWKNKNIDDELILKNLYIPRDKYNKKCIYTVEEALEIIFGYFKQLKYQLIELGSNLYLLKQMSFSNRVLQEL